MRVFPTLLFLVVAPGAALAQRPSPRPAPVPTPEPLIVTVPRIGIPPISVPAIDVGPFVVPEIDEHAVEALVENARDLQFELADLSFDLADLQFDIKPELDFDMKFDLEPGHIVGGVFDVPAPPLPPEPPAPADLPGIAFGTREAFTTRPRAASALQDAADSLYRAAREALNRYEYRRAAQLFRQIRDKYPRSEYAGDAVYWEAFSLYRVGTIDDLRAALRVLESSAPRYSREELQADAPALAARIRGALAVRGDRDAARAVEQAAKANGQPCDREEAAVRVEALSALGQMDGESVLPILRRVLARRDECSTDLRRRALYLLSRRPDADAAATFLSVAKQDPAENVRAEAIGYLARMPGERVVDALEELLRTSTDERVQRSTVRALANHESPRARRTLRALIERSDVSEQLRREAIGSFERERTSAEDAAYLRALYPKLDSQQLKEAVIGAVARLGGPDNEQWLANLVKNPNEPMQLRASALNRLGRTTLPVTEFAKMYDAATERGIREQVMNVLAYRKEPEATDKLFEIARTGTDPQLRRLAINYLTRKNDPRTQKLLLEILDK